MFGYIILIMILINSGCLDNLDQNWFWIQND